MFKVLIKATLISTLLLSIAVVETGCNTMESAQAAKGTGVVRIYNQPYDAVWNATIDSINAIHNTIVVNYGPASDGGKHFTIETANKSEGLILARGMMTSFSWGERVAIYIEPYENQGKTKIEIINKRALSTNITAPQWEKILFNKIDQKLAADMIANTPN